MASSQEREQALFVLALEKPALERQAFLDRECAGDADLRARLDALFAAHDRSAPLLDVEPARPQATMKVDPPQENSVGLTIDRYKLLQRIGEGGCGVVYMAEQEEPVRRRVALKVIKLGMDTKQVIARFEAERQALALMDHPNIAKVLDAGATETGRPYFVMELVRGVKITEFCDESKLPTEDRLELFIQVCQAIQHAHQKGVIHRDIKPSNILVTVNDGASVPKIIDFGIAKATAGRLTDQTLFTAFEQFIGTPAYMSPEQAVMTSLDIDTRSDIYSLGVLLYELLTGRPPFEQKELLAAGLDEMRRTIREKEPPKPSTRLTLLGKEELTTTAQRRQTEAPKLVHRVRGDLDWIVMKCLEKDRTRRYETANGLAADVRRHLSDEPIAARPPSKLYEFQKTVRRHKVGFAVTAAIIMLLAVGIALTTWQARRAVAALEELRGTAPAFAAEARSLAAKERFTEAIEKLNYAIQLRPDVPDYWVAKGDLLQSQLRLAEAAVAYREALQLNPGLARAEASAILCDELIAANPGDGGKLTHQSLARLHVAMQQQQRPAAELMVVARLLGEEKELLLEYWLNRLVELPVSAERPLRDRLSARDDGLLGLDLSDTKIADLATLAGMPVGELNLANCKLISNFVPLHEFRSLKSLGLKGTGVTDLSPLTKLPLEELNLTDTRVFDISSLRGMRLKGINLRGTRVVDLTPLTGMPIEVLDASQIPATDFSPLAGAPLEICNIQASGVRDLSFLRDSRVKRLVLGNCNGARGFAVLSGLKSLDLLVLPDNYRRLPAEELAAIEALRSHPTLRSLDSNERYTGSWTINTTQPKDEFWKAWDREQVLTDSLRRQGVQFNLTLLLDGKYRLTVENQPLRDLSFLKDTPIAELMIQGTSVTDLRPLEELPITHLDLRRTPVRDLSPLRSPVLSSSLRRLDLWRIPATDFSPVAACTNLEWFDAADTALSDLEVLRGRKLRVAMLSFNKITDISAMAGMPLERATLSDTTVLDLRPLLQCPTLNELVVPRGATNISSLRSLPKLGRLSYEESGGGFSKLSAEEFWLGYERGGVTAETISIFSEKSIRNPEDNLLAMKVAALQCWFGLSAEYAATCKRMIESAERENRSDTSERAAKNWCLQDLGDVAMLPRVLKLAREAARVELNPGHRPWRQQTLGMAEFRAGDYEAAESAFLIAEQAASNWHPDDRPFIFGPSCFFRAMMLFQKGKIEEAKVLFRKAEAEMPSIPDNAARVLPLEVNQDQLLYWLAHREAKARLKL